MSLALYWQAASDLFPRQALWRAIRTVRHARWRCFPGAAWARLAARAETLPRPDPRAPLLTRAAEHVRRLNAAVEPDPLHLGVVFRTDKLGEVEKIIDAFETAHPFGAPGALDGAWSPYAASQRLINLTAWMALRKRPDARLIAHVRLCAALVLADAETDVGYNRLLKNYVALAMYGFALRPGPLARVIAQCFRPEGSHVPGDPLPHALALFDLRILRDLGFDVGETCARAEAALAGMPETAAAAPVLAALRKTG